MDIPGTIINLIPKDIALKFRVIPIDRAGNNIIVAMGDPRNLAAIQAVRTRTGYMPKAVLASETRITEALNKYYGNTLDLSSLGIGDAGDKKGGKGGPEKTAAQKAAASGGKAERLDISTGDKGDGPIIRLVNQVLMECINRKASDIHIEPYENSMRVRLRIDGVLHEIVKVPMQMKAAMISRVKIMSALNIAETRLPQDGAINIMVGGNPIDFRVNTVPTIYGEKIVMRILDKSNLQVDMTQLGFEVDELAKFKSSIHNPFGMVLVTGPTGSGKTTTLYSALAELNQSSDNIMTAEDPVEYNLEGVNQVQMKPDIGLNFAAALKSFLRQDPDIIMVGEVRDLETAEIAVKAALTGHMVLSTLHTNNAVETIGRLMNMGLESFNLVSALTCITAQRLLRKNCEKCRVVDESVTPQVLVQLGIHPSYADKVKAYKGAGCGTCNGTGCKGRIAVHEVLKLSDPVRDGIIQGLPAMHLKRIAMTNGMRSLRQSALTKLAKGLVSAAEVTSGTIPDSDDVSGNRGAA
jgi:type IV pilus assembly protein PilB